jgi:tetratricopeptide (TPR) repeat protein
MNWEDVQRLRRDGQLDQARGLALEILAADPADFRTKGQYQWVVFNFIKLAVAEISEALDKRPLTARDIDPLMALLQEYRDLQPRIPDLACSVILGQVAKVGQHLSKFPGIIHWVGIEGLRSEDWQPNEFEGKTLPSLATNIARTLCKWVRGRPDASKRQKGLALEWAERARKTARGDDALWLDWDLAILLRQMGDSQRAAKLLADVIKAKRNDFWVWAEAGRLYQSEQPELSLACFCRALECPAEPKFLVRAHRELAGLLAEQEEYAQASQEVAITIDIRQTEGWPVGREMEELIASPWYDPSAMGAEDPKAFYRRHSPAALALCFDIVETKAASFLGIVTSQAQKERPPGRKPRQSSRFAVRDGEGHPRNLNGPRFRTLKAEPGDPVTIVVGRQAGEDRETVVQVVRRPEGSPWDCTKRVQGRLERKAGGFAFVKNGKDVNGLAFVQDVFVTPDLVELVGPDVSKVAAWAVYGKHPTRDEHTWRAVRLSEAS